LQLTASRARSLVFERLFPARSRQLNAKPFGGSIHISTDIDDGNKRYPFTEPIQLGM
jgi:hypothetical protein